MGVGGGLRFHRFPVESTTQTNTTTPCRCSMPPGRSSDPLTMAASYFPTVGGGEWQANRSSSSYCDGEGVHLPARPAVRSRGRGPTRRRGATAIEIGRGDTVENIGRQIGQDREMRQARLRRWLGSIQRCVSPRDGPNGIWMTVNRHPRTQGLRDRVRDVYLLDESGAAIICPRHFLPGQDQGHETTPSEAKTARVPKQQAGESRPMGSRRPG